MIFVKDSWPGDSLSRPSLSEADFQLQGKLLIFKVKSPTAKSPAFISTFVCAGHAFLHSRGMDRISPSGCFWKVCGLVGKWKRKQPSVGGWGTVKPGEVVHLLRRQHTVCPPFSFHSLWHGSLVVLRHGMQSCLCGHRQMRGGEP